MALCFSSVGFLEPSLLSDARRPTLDYFSPSQPGSAFRMGSASTFEGHSEASDAFARTFQDYPSPGGMSSGNREFLRFPATFSSLAENPNPRSTDTIPVRNSAK